MDLDAPLFCPESLQFLFEVKLQNSKQWYTENKDRYTELLYNPFQQIVTALSETMLTIDHNFEVRPLTDKTISRIYRDTRFSKDKSLYRDAMWLTFKKVKEDWQEHPAYFFEITPGAYRYGMGFYSATTKAMNAFRARIDKDTDGFRKRVLKNFRKLKNHALEGDLYKKRLYTGQDEAIAAWYNRKNLCIIYNSNHTEDLYSQNIIEDMRASFVIMADIYKYLSEIIGLL